MLGSLLANAFGVGRFHLDQIVYASLIAAAMLIVALMILLIRILA